MWLMCGLNFSLLRLYKHLTCGAYSHTDTSFLSSLMAANLTLRFMESFVSYIVDRTLAYLPGFTALISLAQIGHIETIWQKQQQYRCICLLSGTGSNLQFSQIWKLSKESGCPPHLMWGTKSMLVSLPFGITVSPSIAQSAERIHPPHQLQAFPVKLVSYELEFLSNAGLHAVSRGSLAGQALHAVLLLRASLSTRSVIPDELEACREVQSKTCVTCRVSGLMLIIL